MTNFTGVFSLEMFEILHHKLLSLFYTIRHIYQQYCLVPIVTPVADLEVRDCLAWHHHLEEKKIENTKLKVKETEFEMNIEINVYI